MQYQPIEPDIEVIGQTVWTIVDGFGAFSMRGSKYLLDEGIGEPGPSGLVRIEPERWYPQGSFLRAFQRIGQQMGDSALHLIGRRIPANAIFPPWVVDMDSAIRAVDVAFHLNHRRRQEVMFDQQTGKMLEGIGHYGYRRDSPQVNQIVSVCDNPYPCSFDAGILTAVARKFAKHVRVEHAPGTPCRKLGADACTYLITW